jgi:hypothetical protein
LYRKETACLLTGRTTPADRKGGRNCPTGETSFFPKLAVSPGHSEPERRITFVRDIHGVSAYKLCITYHSCH